MKKEEGLVDALIGNEGTAGGGICACYCRP